MINNANGPVAIIPPQGGIYHDSLLPTDSRGTDSGEVAEGVNPERLNLAASGVDLPVCVNTKEHPRGAPLMQLRLSPIGGCRSGVNGRREFVTVHGGCAIIPSEVEESLAILKNDNQECLLAARYDKSSQIDMRFICFSPFRFTLDPMDEIMSYCRKSLPSSASLMFIRAFISALW